MKEHAGALSSDEARARARAIQHTPAQNSFLNVLFAKGISADFDGMEEATKRQHQYAMNRVVARMPDKAVARAQQNIRQARVFTDHVPVTEGFKERAPFTKLRRNEVILGFYHGLGNALWIDGFMDLLGTNQEETHRAVWSHELGHAIDGPMHELSSSAAWQEAFDSEIGGGQLSNYATSNYQEGFAEFSRLAYGTDMDQAEVKKQFPKCFAFFRKRGLI